MWSFYQKTKIFFKNKFFVKKHNPYYKNKEVTWNDISLQKFNYPSEKFIKKCSDEMKNKLELKIKEVEFICGFYDFFPTKIDDKDWSVLLECNNTKETLNQIKFFRKKELLKEKDKKKKITKKNDIIIPRKRTEFSEVGINYTNFRFEEITADLNANNYLTSLKLNNSPKIVIDCRYIPSLSIRGQNLTLLQLKYVIYQNRMRSEPWPVCLANFNNNLNESIMIHLKHYNKTRFLENCTTKNYTELYDLSKIVYLSPDGENELDDIKGDEIFVIGGIVDRVKEHNIPHHASLDAAMKDNVKCVKLPLDKYVKWKSGNKFLTITAVVNILQDLYDTNNDWKYSIKKNLPVRKIRAPEENFKKDKEFKTWIREYDRKVITEVEKKLSEHQLMATG